MKKYTSIKEGWTPNPYLTIAVAAILAYLPVSSMLFSLRNDVLAIEYPIQHFISECLRNNEFPAWFNTWAMGFPLQSILSWSVYSTPQMLTGFLFESNVIILHLEFVVYIIASGFLMYKLLKTHFLRDQNLSLLLACCYMLSGFTVGSSQWLLYITGMVFIPLVLYCFISLVKKPSLKYGLMLPVSYYLLLTNTHIYITVVFTYIFIIFLAIYFSRLAFSNHRTRQEKRRVLRFTTLAFLLTLLFCAAPVYYSLELVSYLQRNLPLAKDSIFFQSNYLHPQALSSFLFPLSSVKTEYSNTEGTVLDAYIGLLPLILLPASILISLKQKSRTAWILLFLSIFFLVISFGHLTPVRAWLNIFPGMSHFRHPGVLRVFFNLAFIIYLAESLKNNSLSGLLQTNSAERKVIIISSAFLFLIALVILISYAGNLPGVWESSVYQSIKTISKDELYSISAVIQLCFTSVLLLFILTRKQKFFSFFILMELVVNTLICTPFFTVSTYTATDVNKIFQPTRGFPVQKSFPFDVQATISDQRNNFWWNINTYRKEVSTRVSMPGPLILQKFTLFLDGDSLRQSLAGKPLVFIHGDTANTAELVNILVQLPGKVITEIALSEPRQIVLQQVRFPGWKAYHNNKEIPLSNDDMPFVSATVPAGRGKLMFKYEKDGVFFSAILLHLVVISISFYFLRRIRFRPSSPS